MKTNIKNNKTNASKKAIATKALKKFNTLKGPESEGFKRYLALPQNMSFALALSHEASGHPANTLIATIRSFFGKMKQDEFKTWVIANA